VQALPIRTKLFTQLILGFWHPCCEENKVTVILNMLLATDKHITRVFVNETIGTLALLATNIILLNSDREDIKHASDMITVLIALE